MTMYHKVQFCGYTYYINPENVEKLEERISRCSTDNSKKYEYLIISHIAIHNNEIVKNRFHDSFPFDISIPGKVKTFGLTDEKENQMFFNC